MADEKEGGLMITADLQSPHGDYRHEHDHTGISTSPYSRTTRASLEKRPLSSAGFGSWLSRHRARFSMVAALLIIVIVAAVVIPVVFTVSSQRAALSGQERDNLDVYEHRNSDGRDAFDNSAKPNAYTPPLSEPFRYGSDKIRGVNLGGWLVIEPFITPSLFDQFKPEDKVVDEWGLCAKLGPDEAKRQLQQHYDTFVTENDFKTMAQMGLNHVRIPMGHWAIEKTPDEPFVPHLSWDYLIKGIQWARKYGLRVMVELHTAPGSQNGWNHSGKSGTIGWLNGTHGEENAKRTLEIIQTMIQFLNKPEWNHVTPVFGVLNEPAIYRLDKERVKTWYRESYDAIRKITGPDGGPYLTYHEGFLGMPSWTGFFTNEHYKRVILETHTYLIFDDTLVSMPRDRQAAFPCGNWRRDLQQSMSAAGPTMVGEFSVATNDCGKYLNGVGLGTRYEGTLEQPDGSHPKPVCAGCSCATIEDWKHWTTEYKGFLKQFVERQMDAFESSFGWFFWTYKTENHNNPHWDYLLGWEQGWIPSDANNRTYSCRDVAPMV